MNVKFMKKVIYIWLSVGLFGAVFIFISHMESKNCLGLPIIEEEELVGYTETNQFDISHMKYNGENIAVDFPSNSVFISQSNENVKNIQSLAGEITAIDSEYSLAILKTMCFDNLSEKVRDGEPLVLIIKSGELYQRVNLIITTLPVLYLDFESNSEDDQGRNLNMGKMTLWNNYDSSLGYKTVTSDAEWRLRGNSTRSFDKKAWKLNLRDESNDNRNLDLIGFGSDDDWILNPMSMDDTFVKEKLVQELWEQIIADTNYNYKMSKGEYVELFINGAYQGVYLLQRRIDMKYLGVNTEKDILLKGINTWEAEKVNDGYEIVSSPLNTETTYTELEDALNFNNENQMNINNFIDVSLMLQFISGSDNVGYKNMFYLMKEKEGSYEMYLVPWDTDLSFGVTWGYNYEESISAIIERQEIDKVRANIEDFDLKLANRWKELRLNILSEENIFLVLEGIVRELDTCGGIARDQKLWGTLHGGKDSIENMQDFIKERLILLDEYYISKKTDLD